MRVAVLGVGLIGGSIGLAARERLAAEVVGWDPDPGASEGAAARGALDRGAESVGAACAEAEIVFCAAPVGALPGLAREALDACDGGTVVTDVGSTKRALVAELGADERFVGGHPLAGAESDGVANSRADLFEGARWYLTPAERSSGLLYDRLQRAVAGMGARPRAIDAALHDRLMATVSHLPHVLANVLVSQAAEELTAETERLPEAGPSFRDATRVAGANPPLWADILGANADAVADAVDSAAERLREAAELLRGGDREDLARWQSAAAADRRRLSEPEHAAGPLREVRVVIENRPGVFAGLALALGDAGVNIEDMALHPAADMRSGAISVWVAGAEAAGRAAELVRGLGHTATVHGGED